jgi:hypothetical protein
MVKNFYQEEDGRWYIDLPEYIESGVGTKSNLEMVAGADTFLSTLAQGETSITLKFTDEEFVDHDVELIRSSNHGYTSELMDDVELDAGAWYTVKDNDHNLWLCPVVLYLFNNTYPQNIFIQIL